MAEPFDTLMAVQHHDTALDQLRHRRSTLPEQTELAQVAAHQAELHEQIDVLDTQVAELASRQQRLEEQIAASAARRREIEQRMLAGDVSASRDLQAMDTEVRHLSERQAQLEDQELALVEEEEPLDQSLAEARSALAGLDADSARLRLSLAGAVSAIDADIIAKTAARVEAAASLPADLAERYEALRSRLGGVGAARLVGDRCDGCHLSLPSVEVERIRSLGPTEFATCDQCGRLLAH